MNPLDQLADITPPDAVSIWPLAWGYWLVLAIILVLVIYCIFAVKKFRQKRQVKREALLTLSKLDTNSKYYAHDVQLIMKSLCSHYLPLAKAAQLYANQWKSFVLAIYQGSDTERLALVIDNMYSSLYSANNGLTTDTKEQVAQKQQNEQVQVTVKEWISTSFPCKKVKRDQLNVTQIATQATSEMQNV